MILLTPDFVAWHSFDMSKLNRYCSDKHTRTFQEDSKVAIYQVQRCRYYISSGQPRTRGSESKSSVSPRSIIAWMLEKWLRTTNASHNSLPNARKLDIKLLAWY